MPDLTAKRTLVKSPPELWEQLSEVEGLSKHFGAFGEITITKLEPEHTVAWEGEHGSGTVSIEPSGWGTKVTLHAELPEGAAEEPTPEAATPEAATPEAATPEAATPEPEPAEPDPEPEPEAAELELERAEPEPEPIDMEPVLVEPVSLPEHDPKAKRGFFAWLFRSRTAATSAEPEPLVTEPEPAFAEPEPLVTEPAPAPGVSGSALASINAVEVEAQTDAEPEEEPRIDAEGRTDAEREEPRIDAEKQPVTKSGAAPQIEAEEQSPELPASLDPERARLVLDEALDALGAAHHRPFSRG